MTQAPTRDEVTRPQSGPGWISDRLGVWLAQSWPVAALAAGLAALGVSIVAGHPSIVLLPLVAFLATFGLSRTLGPPDRAVALGLFGWAIVVRLLVIVALSLASAEYLAGGLLSPDGTGYLDRTAALVRSDFNVGPPFAFFGTYDIGQYYVFAAVMKVLGSDFVVLAVFNAAVGALAAPVAFAWARIAVPRHAGLIGIIAALSPTLAFLSTTNVLKDPMVILGTLVVALAMGEALRLDTKGRGLWLWLGIGAIALAFLHTTRFYVAAYLELGLIVVAAVQLVRTRGRPPWRTRLVALAAAILMAELISVSPGWPSSPALVSSQVQHVVNTPAMQAPGGSYPIPGLGTSISLARRMFGPFVWVLPAELDLKYLVLADFDLYADTLLWYVILPFLAVGIVLALASVWRHRDADLGLGSLAIFLCLYLGQYLAINLSYRQREDVFLITLAFVPAGAAWLLSRSPGRALYAGYWGVLITLAAGHLLLRASG